MRPGAGALARPKAPFPPYALGHWVIRRAPGRLATTAIDQLGHQAKHLAAAACVLGAVGLGATFGRRRPLPLGAVAMAASVAAGLLDPRKPAAGDIVGVALLGGLVALAAATAIVRRPCGATDQGRRRLLALGTIAVTGLALGAGAARRTLRQVAAAVVRADRPARVQPDATLAVVARLSPAITSRTAHYTVGIDPRSRKPRHRGAHPDPAAPRRRPSPAGLHP